MKEKKYQFNLKNQVFGLEIADFTQDFKLQFYKTETYFENGLERYYRT